MANKLEGSKKLWQVAIRTQGLGRVVQSARKVVGSAGEIIGSTMREADKLPQNLPESF